MNERIKELIEQATSNISVDHEGYRGKGYTEQVEYFDKEKFAELIVKECMAVGFHTVYKVDDDRNAVAVYQNIKEHFGVD